MVLRQVVRCSRCLLRVHVHHRRRCCRRARAGTGTGPRSRLLRLVRLLRRLGLYRRLLLKVVVDKHEILTLLLLPPVGVKHPVVPTLVRGGFVGGGRLLCASEPALVNLVEPPLPIAELLRRCHLQDIPGHGVEDVEQCLQLEALEVLEAQSWRLQSVALGKPVFRLHHRLLVGPRTAQGGIHRLGRVKWQAQVREIIAKRQCVQIVVSHPDNVQDTRQPVLTQIVRRARVHARLDLLRRRRLNQRLVRQLRARNSRRRCRHRWLRRGGGCLRFAAKWGELLSIGKNIRGGPAGPTFCCFEVRHVAPRKGRAVCAFVVPMKYRYCSFY
eukprot:Rhum_TRINITY_DN20724_c0_g1::Rhum_TRINITY_DN20724_c0_g1_i1::g.171967::m.171967